MASLNTVIRITTSVSGGGGNDASAYPAISSDNRFVVYSSYATNLVDGDPSNRVADVFLRDLVTGETTILSTSSGGTYTDGGAWFPSISGDGNLVVFQSYAGNLVSPDANGRSADAYLRNVEAGTTEIVSFSTDGIQGNGNSWNPSISDDGHIVVFRSVATNLVANDDNGNPDVFARDLVTGTTVCVSSTADGVLGNGSSWDPDLNADGSLVVFSTTASNLFAHDTNNLSDVVVKSLATGAVTLVSSSSAGVEGNGASQDGDISLNGRFVVFSSRANNLVAGDTNGRSDIFIKDLLTGETKLVSCDESGVFGDGNSYHPSVSADGRYVAFESGSSNLGSGDTDGKTDVFVKDMLTGEIIEITAPAINSANLHNYEAFISADGSLVAFETSTTYLAHGDRVFGRDIYLASLSWSPSEFVGHGGADSLVGTMYADSMAGLGGNDTLGAGWGDDTLVGGAGQDSILGGEGADSIAGEGGDDTLFGGAGDDFITGGGGSDSIWGGDGADTLSGEYGADTLIGGNGDDLIAGGAGADQLSGGAGADRFVFTSPSHSPVGAPDTIVDFHSGEDKIVLSGFGSPVTFIGEAGFSGSGAVEVRYDAGLYQIQVDVDGNGVLGADDMVINGPSHVLASDLLLG